MYILATLADVVQLHPKDFDKPSLRAIEEWINAKYSDRVVQGIGLVVCFHSLLSASEGLIGHGTGIVNVNVDFKILVFRPHKGEILRASIAASNMKGIYLTTKFFEDIVIPPHLLFEGTVWDADDQGVESFIFRPEDGSGYEFFFDRYEEVLFRVEQEEWTDLSPQMKRPGEDVEEEVVDQYGLRVPPYRVLGRQELQAWTGKARFLMLSPTQWDFHERLTDTKSVIDAIRGEMLYPVEHKV
nr:dna-directed rna polymerase iii subunit rpc8 [Quercus suber]